MGTGPTFSLFIISSALSFVGAVMFLYWRTNTSSNSRENAKPENSQGGLLSNPCARLIVPAGVLLSAIIVLIWYHYFPLNLYIARLHDAVFHPAVGQFIVGVLFGVYCAHWVRRARHRQAILDNREKRAFDVWQRRAWVGDNASKDPALKLGTLLGDHAHHIGHGTIATILLVAGLFGPGLIALSDRITSISTSFAEAQFANVKGTKDQIFEIEKIGKHLSYIRYLSSFDRIRLYEDFYYLIENDTNGKNSDKVFYDYDFGGYEFVPKYNEIIENITNYGVCYIEALNNGASEQNLNEASIKISLYFDKLSEYSINELAELNNKNIKTSFEFLDGLNDVISTATVGMRTKYSCEPGASEFHNLADKFPKITKPYLIKETTVYYLVRARALISFLAGNLAKAKWSAITLLDRYQGNPQLEAFIGDVYFYADSDYGSSIKFLQDYESSIRKRIRTIQECETLADNREVGEITGRARTLVGGVCVHRNKAYLTELKSLYLRALLQAINAVAYRIAEGMAEGDPQALSEAPLAETRAQQLWKAISLQNIEGEQLGLLLNPLSILSHQDTISYARLMSAARRSQPDRKKMSQALRMLRAVKDGISKSFGLEVLDSNEPVSIIYNRYYQRTRKTVGSHVRQAELLLQ